MPHIDSGWAKVGVAMLSMIFTALVSYGVLRADVREIDTRVRHLEVAEHDYANKLDNHSNRLRNLEIINAKILQTLADIQNRITSMQEDIKDIKRGRNRGYTEWRPTTPHERRSTK